MKTAVVKLTRSGLWEAIADDTGRRLGGGLHDTELDAYKAANRDGYIVR